MLQSLEELSKGRRRPAPRHVVDQLIEERARHLSQDPVLWPLIRTFVYPILQYGKAIDMADEIADQGGVEVLDRLSRLLHLRLEVSGLQHVPKTGPVIIVANHPSGIADGIAVYDALKQVRPDITFFANRDAIRVAPRLDEVLIPVEWVAENRSPARSRETLKASVEALNAGRAVVLFPSGRIAQAKNFRLRERPWLTTPISLARKYHAPILPMHVRSRNSLLYYALWKISPELRDMTLFHELLNKRGKLFGITVAEPAPPSTLTGDAEELISELQSFVEDDLAEGRADALRLYEVARAQKAGEAGCAAMQAANDAEEAARTVRV